MHHLQGLVDALQAVAHGTGKHRVEQQEGGHRFGGDHLLLRPGARVPLDGVITDGEGQSLSADALDQIGGDLQQLYDALDARELSAGSPQARRLFS